jgi:hypothetical protein
MKRTRSGWRRAGGLFFVAALAGCQPEQPKEKLPQTGPQQPAPSTVAKTQPTEPTAAMASVDALPPPAPAPPVDAESAESVWRVLGSPDLRRVLQVHRYVGTVGGRPATAELQWYTTDSITGRFYLHQSGTSYSLRYSKKRPGPVSLGVMEEGYPEESAQGQWRLAGRLGRAVLQAAWHNGHRTQAVILRESYTGAVRYGMRNRLLVDGTASVLCNFFVLPAPASVRPSLHSLLSPGPKSQLRQLRNLTEGLTAVTHTLNVRLNDFGLFSYQTCHYSRMVDSTPDIGFESTLLDLTTGRPLTIASQLRPGYELPLRRLLTKHFLHDPEFDQDDRARLTRDWDNPALADFPDMDLGLTETGLDAFYWQPMYPANVLIPYPELRPLVRPGTPLARMLAARKLW